MVWQGCVNPPQADDVNSPVATTPIIKEKPFLFIDSDGEYKVFVPGWQKDRIGISWTSKDMGQGKVQDLLAQWYVTKEGDTDVEINAALKAGKNIFFQARNKKESTGSILYLLRARITCIPNAFR